MMLVLPLACQTETEPESFDPAVDPNDRIIPTINLGTEEPTSRLHIRYQDEGNLNPLLKHSYSTQAVFTLVYDSLFSFNASGALLANLVDSATLANNQLTWTINLKDIDFHSGEKLTSVDVEASLRFWLEENLDHTPSILSETEQPAHTDNEEEAESTSEPEEVSEDDLTPEAETDDTTLDTSEEISSDDYDYYIDTPKLGEPAQIDLYSGTLSVSMERGRLIEAIDTPNANTIRIKLREAAPILDLLTFPIIPAEHVENNSYGIIPGTGDYQIVERDVNGNLHLLWQADEEEQIREIIAYNCADVMDALDLFENNNLDILLLEREEASRLQKRSRVRSQDYTDSGFVSLFVPNSGLRAQILAALSNVRPNYISAPFPDTPYYIRPGDFRLFDQDEIVTEPSTTSSTTVSSSSVNPFTGDPANTIDEEREDLPVYRVLMPIVFYPFGLQNQLKSLILQCGARTEFIMVRAEDYQQQLAEQDYDIALLLDESASFGDPLDYALGLLSYNLINDLFLSAAQISILEDGRARQAVICEDDGDIEARYMQTVHELFVDLPVIGLCTTSTLLWYRDGVDGILSGTAELPYEGVESLIIWQP